MVAGYILNWGPIHCCSTMPSSSLEYRPLENSEDSHKLNCELQDLLFVSLLALASPCGPPTLSKTSIWQHPRNYGSLSRFSKVFFPARGNADKGWPSHALWVLQRPRDSPGFSYLGICTASWLGLCLPD